MEKYLQVRIDEKLRDEFKKVAKRQGTDVSTLIRRWVKDYVDKHKSEHDKIIDTLYDRGQELKKHVSKKDLFELMNFLKADHYDDFIKKAMEVYITHNLEMPKELLDIRDNADYGYAFLTGLMGEKRKED